MRKTVEIEYVGIEDLQDIMDDAYALMQEGHFVSIELANVGEKPLFSVNIMVGGFDVKKNFDYGFRFYMSDEESEVKTMNECRSILNNLLAEVK